MCDVVLECDNGLGVFCLGDKLLFKNLLRKIDREEDHKEWVYAGGICFHYSWVGMEVS